MSAYCPMQAAASHPQEQEWPRDFDIRLSVAEQQELLTETAQDDCDE